MNALTTRDITELVTQVFDTLMDQFPAPSPDSMYRRPYLLALLAHRRLIDCNTLTEEGGRVVAAYGALFDGLQRAIQEHMLAIVRSDDNTFNYALVMLRNDCVVLRHLPDNPGIY